jgi:hypothetical protein
VSQFTKKAIIEAFVGASQRKAFDKITDIDTRKMRVNMNTFYYYYPDVYALYARTVP